MRLIFGIILGGLLTVGGAYVIDADAPAKDKMVNWDVAAAKFDSALAFARQSWKKITD